MLNSVIPFNYPLFGKGTQEDFPESNNIYNPVGEN